MKVKPKEVLLTVPHVLMVNDPDEIAQFAANVNTVLHGKVRLKYEELGLLGEQFIGIVYLQRNDEYQMLRDEMMNMINLAEVGQTVEQQEQEEAKEQKSRVNLLSREELEGLTTARLLAYKTKLLQVPEQPDWDNDDRLNKTSPEWRETYADVKTILAGREHMERIG